MWGNARNILALAWPILIGQLAIIAFGVIDTAMVGRYSATDLAALGLGASVYISVYIGLTGILTALQPIIGQLFGANHRDEIGESVRQGAWLGLLLAVLGCIALLYPAGLLRIAHASADLNQRTVAYLRILAFGLPAALCFRIYNSLSNAISKPRFVMLVQVASLALKVPLNAWFIFGGLGLPALGGPGCALASTLINWAGALIGLLIMARHRDYAVFKIFKRLSWPRWRDQFGLLKLGVPMGLSYLIEVTAYTFMALFIARFGTTALAGHQIAANLGAVLYMTPLSIGIATSTLVSQALGAGRRADARLVARHGIVLAFAIALLYGVALAMLRTQVVSAYTPDPRVAAAAAPLILIVVFYHLCDALQVSTVFILRAYKVAVVPTVIYALALWGVGLGGGYLLGFHLEGPIAGNLGVAWEGARGFWLANTVSLGLAAIGLLAYLRRTSAAPG